MKSVRDKIEKNYPCEKGFTLIESLVSIAILMVAITGAMTLASKSIASASLTRNRLIATMLAQEGVEQVRASRDDQFIKMLDYSGSPPVNAGERWLDTIDGPASCWNGCIVKLDPSAGKPNFANLEDSKNAAGTEDYTPVYLLESSPGNPAFYFQTDMINPPGALPTIFKRKITTTGWHSLLHSTTNAQVQELQVVVKVEWKDRFTNGCTVNQKKSSSGCIIIEATLFNWIPDQLQEP